MAEGIELGGVWATAGAVTLNAANQKVAMHFKLSPLPQGSKTRLGPQAICYPCALHHEKLRFGENLR